MLRIITPCSRDKIEQALIVEHVAEVCCSIQHEHIVNCGPYVFKNRNLGLEPDADCLQWDSDIRATPEAVKRIASHKEIAGGAYIHRRFQSRWCAGVWATEPRPEEEMLVSCIKRAVYRVPWVGAGFLFIPAGRLAQLKKPYFRHEFIEDGQTGEDVGFCMAAMRAGLDIYLDAGCIVEHLI
jgi:hypothetical protein